VREAHDAGDVAEHVELAEARDAGGDGVAARGGIRDVEALRDGGAAAAGDRGDGLGEAGVGDVAREDPCALRCEADRGGATDAGGGAGDEGGSGIEIGSRVRSPSCGRAGIRGGLTILARAAPRAVDERIPMPNFSEIPWIAEHIKLYRSDPEKARLWDSTPAGGPGVLPTLLLTTTGRKSGEPRALPLIYGEAGKSYVVIASKAGCRSTHLVHQPRSESPLRADGGREEADGACAVAEGAERERLWKQMVAIYPPYEAYQKNATPRVIPVVVLDPVG